jgi:hypothetical protein
MGGENLTMMKKICSFPVDLTRRLAGQWRACRHKISTLLKRIAKVAGENKNKKTDPLVCNPAPATPPAVNRTP